MPLFEETLLVEETPPGCSMFEEVVCASVPLYARSPIETAFLLLIGYPNPAYQMYMACTCVSAQLELCFGWSISTYLATQIAIILTLFLTVVLGIASVWNSNRFAGNLGVTAIMVIGRWCAEQPRLAAQSVRSKFNNMPVPTFKPSGGTHSHAESAAARNAAAPFMRLFASLLGLEAYFMQKSAADDRHGYRGSRAYYWAKDLATAGSAFLPTMDDMLCLVDVDMYIDMEELLACHNQPVLLHTFQPQKVAKSQGDYSYTFDGDDNVLYQVCGGAVFIHKVWSYAGDVLWVHSRSWFGLWCTSTSYNIDRLQWTDDHQMILLTPAARVSFFLFHWGYMLQGDTLSRLAVNVPSGPEEFLRLDVQTPSGLLRSTGRAGSWLEVTIPASVDDAIASQARVCNNPITVAQVKSITSDSGVEDTGRCSLLTEFHRLQVPEKVAVVTSVAKSVQRYQFEPKQYDPTAKPAVTPFMSSIITPVFAPDKCVANDRACVDGRIRSVANFAEDMEVDSITMTMINEFAELMVPENQKHKAFPFSHEEVYDKQARPQQRRIYAEATSSADTTSRTPVSCFMKSETYQKVADPRNITTLPGKEKIGWSRYTYAFAVHMRTFVWYAFGLAPLAIAERVAQVASKASNLVLTDLSRFDGRVAKVLRTLERVVMLRFFHPLHHAEMTELQASQKDRRGYTAFGVSFDSGDSRLSGSPETADFNSVDNAFMAYCTLRRTLNPATGSFYTPLEAWGKLGLYAGDDGLTPDADPAVYEQTCKKFGQVLELDVVPRGKPGVNFLARYYSPSVWWGETNSMCDVKRQLGKINVTPALPPTITPLQKLTEKLAGYARTDLNTPLIGDLVRVFSTKHAFPGELGVGLMRGVASYSSLSGPDQQYPNTREDWMIDIVRLQLPDFDHSLYAKWLEECKNGTGDFLAPPLCVPQPTEPISSPAPVVVNGDIVGKEPEKKPCRYYLLGKCTFGAKCKQLHVGTPSAAPQLGPCKDFQKGSCKRAVCKFPHVPVGAKA